MTLPIIGNRKSRSGRISGVVLRDFRDGRGTPRSPPRYGAESVRPAAFPAVEWLMRRRVGRLRVSFWMRHDQARSPTPREGDNVRRTASPNAPLESLLAVRDGTPASPRSGIAPDKPRNDKIGWASPLYRTAPSHPNMRIGNASGT